ncbi:hypothetical protein [Oceanicoccus sp. KOV_DT_Chl]|uniref:hypothetical protein n=1 Tax=Oceanicoccus sp. KOV_DT_Chl TaxID=1904639 RepID=UPI000C7D0B7A|nr:hypothetical protein [Oceanicoccus sp. KOV_DT_Chl]
MHETLPENWAKDDLSEYLDISMSNGVATFANSKEDYNTLKEIDGLFVLAGNSIDNPEEIWPAVLFYRAHSAFRSAIYLVMAGHQIESFTVMRQAIEYALYANHMVKRPQSVQIWLDRPNSPKDTNKCRSEFSHGNVMKSVKNKKLNEITRQLYGRCIDYGAHPNEASVFSSMMIDRSEKGKAHLKQTYLTCEGQIMAFTVKTAKTVGVCVLDIFLTIWKERFQIVGIDEKLNKHKSVL